MSAPLLATERLGKRFGGGRRLLGGTRPALHAVQEVSLDLAFGETLGIVGESGCGKSTLARMLVGLERPSAGRIALRGRPLAGGRDADGRPLAASLQYVFQDPVDALNPRKTVRAILEAPLRHLLGYDRERRERRLAELVDAVRLDADHLQRFPHEFSGGQAQRIGIARALAAEPAAMVLDEPVSALDVSVQAQILALLAELRERLGLAYLFISHDLSVVRAISDRVAVMYFGRVVETAAARRLFGAPRHPYTRLLLDSVPGPGGLGAETGPAELPDPWAPPPGCPFAPRCPRAEARCRAERPTLGERGETGHAVACHFPRDSYRIAVHRSDHDRGDATPSGNCHGPGRGGIR